MSVEFSNESGMDIEGKPLVDLLEFCLKNLDIDIRSEIFLLLVDEATMAKLHLQWMDLPGPTDVMSFPMDELRPGSKGKINSSEPSLLGDIVLCPKFAADQAIKAGHMVEEEYNLLVVHGLLHLLGYDHAEPEEKAEMFGLQRALLLQWVAYRQQLKNSKQDDNLLSQVEDLLNDL